MNMVTWEEATSGGGVNLLPEGTRPYEVSAARPEVNKHTGRREVLIALSSSAGSGETTVPLESWGDEDLFLRIFGGQAQGLGFKPADPTAPITQADIDAFSRYVSSLVGAVVEAKVEHKESTKLKDDGTPFVNHRVYFNKLVMHAPGATPAQVEQPVAAAVGVDDDIPF